MTPSCLLRQTTPIPKPFGNTEKVAMCLQDPFLTLHLCHRHVVEGASYTMPCLYKVPFLPARTPHLGLCLHLPNSVHVGHVSVIVLTSHFFSGERKSDFELGFEE